MNFASFLLRIAGWKVDISVPDYPKCIICVAPHTSNWDFILGKLAYASIGRTAGFLIKEAWFKWPMCYFFKAVDGIAVPKARGSQLSEILIKKFETAGRMQLAITPEGTRSRVTKWRTGFLHIAKEANVPLLLGAIDAANKRVVIDTEYIPTDDIDADMRAIKNYYRQFSGIKPDNFTVEE